MSSVIQADNTYAQIEKMVRRLTASASESALKSVDIQNQVNIFYSNDFPYGIKLDQMRNVYSFLTSPNVDQYPLDVNYNQGVRSPVYVDGIQGFFYKDRMEFFGVWPKWPSRFNPISGDSVTTTFSFTIPGPFLAGEVTLGGVDLNGNPIRVQDNGFGRLYLEVPNGIISVPSQSTNPAKPGMYNINTNNPGLQNPTDIGSVNYVTGSFAINFPVAPIAGQQMSLFVSQYQTGKPYSVLFWNNIFTIRPVPKLVHKIELETYLTPVQFMLTTDSPILNQWVQYIAYGTAMEILRQRQDMAGVQNLMEGFKRQEGLVLERQGVEEIGQRNSTIFAGSTPTQGFNGGWSQGFWY